ncbi:MAG: hypothetical protein IPO40_22460 [Fibrobacteres bacterium]|nr:hypothetical protein [Fibrobacterota bacterium]
MSRCIRTWGEPTFRTAGLPAKAETPPVTENLTHAVSEAAPWSSSSWNPTESRPA